MNISYTMQLLTNPSMQSAENFRYDINWTFLNLVVHNRLGLIINFILPACLHAMRFVFFKSVRVARLASRVILINYKASDFIIALLISTQ